MPVRVGEISCRILGCAVDAFDDAARSCPDGVTGELVITAPMPSMPVGLWGDNDGSRLAGAYFSVYPGVWRHGDWVTFAPNGASVISGRSDATLNRGGVRLGTSDFYGVIESFPEVADSLVVHLEQDDQLLLFVAMADGHHLDDGLRGAICESLRRQLSPRHAPDTVVEVPAVPRTLTGKRCEIPVKRVLLGEPPEATASVDSLADPSSLDYFVSWRNQRR